MKRINKTWIIKKMQIFFIMLSFYGVLNAQSKIKNEEGKEVIQKLSENVFEMLPAGVVRYVIDEENRLWALFSGIPEEKPRGSFKDTDDQMKFYDEYGNLVGYFLYSESRFYSAVADGDLVSKEESLAVISEGILYLNFAEKTFEYKIDEDLDIPIVGFYLFIL